MKILMAVVTGIIFMVNFAVVSAANIMDYPRVAVMQFGNKAIKTSGLREHDFNSASEYAIYQLSASGWFDLIDYEQLNAIAKMHNINNSGMVDPATVVQMGKFAGAQFMVVGNVTGLTSKATHVIYEHGRKAELGVQNRTVIANVAMRIVDIETGRIIVAGLGKGESSSANVEIAYKKYRNSRNNIGTATDMSTSETEGMSLDEALENLGDAVTETAMNELTDLAVEGTVNTIQNIADSSNSNENDENSDETYGVGGYEDNGVEEMESYVVKIGAEEFSDVQVRNAISKAVRDAIYGKMGLLTTLNGGKPLKIKTGF